MFDAMVTNTWVAARTERLRVGSLVLCDSFRHPAVLAREAVSLDHASGGRFELGIGWGSVARELETFGVGSTEPRIRVRAAQGDARDRAGPVGRRDRSITRASTSRCARRSSSPARSARIPIVIGGAGKRTLELVRGARRLVERPHRHRRQARRDAAAAPAGARCSLQVQVGVRPVRGATRRGRGDGPPPLRRHPGRRHGARARRVLRVAGRSGRRAGVRVVLRLRATRDAGRLRGAGHRSAVTSCLRWPGPRRRPLTPPPAPARRAPAPPSSPGGP